MIDTVHSVVTWLAAVVAALVATHRIDRHARACEAERQRLLQMLSDSARESLLQSLDGTELQVDNVLNAPAPLPIARVVRR